MHWAPLGTWTALAAATAATARLALDHGKLALVDTATASALASSTFTSDSPNPLPHRELGDTDSLRLSFTLSRDGQPFVPQQAAVLVQPVNEHDRAPGRHWTSPAKVRASTGKAKWELDLSTAPPQLLSLASFAPLSFTLLVGHPHEDAPLALALGTFSLPASLALPHPYPPVHDLPAHWEAERYAKMPTIEWTFRAGEKRVNGVVALVATAAVLAPWLVLLATLTPLVPSLRLSRPSTLSLPLLLVSLALFEALFVAYWLRLSLFDAAPFAAALALVAALVGRGALGELLGRRRDAERREMGKTQ